MSRNGLYFVIAVLAVIAVALGADLLREESKPDGVEIKLDEKVIAVEQN